MNEKMIGSELQKEKLAIKDLLLKYMAGDSHEHTVFSNPATRHEADYTFEQVFNYIKEEINEGESQIQFVVFAEHPSDAGKPELVDGQALLEHQQQIKIFNEAQESGPKLISGVESSIISADGALDVPDEVLAQMELVIASKHDLKSAFPEQNGKPSPEQLTNVYLNLMNNPNVDVIGHPNRYVGYDALGQMDWPKLFETSKNTHTALEININAPMPDWLIKNAVKAGVPLFIGTDAHTLVEYQRLAEEEQMAIETSDDRLEHPLGVKYSFWKKIVRILRVLEEANTPKDQIITSSYESLNGWISTDKKDRNLILAENSGT